MDEQNIENEFIEDTLGKSNIEETEKLVEERKKKLAYFLKTRQIWVIGILIIAIILGVYIRSLPMQDHNPNAPGNQPGLWDITTNTWTLGPDLDPWLFTRYAQTIVERGNLPKVDYMRNVPLGFDAAKELQMVSYMIVLTYKLVNFFGDYNILFAAAFMPVILFALTIISFFLFVRELFTRKKSEEKNLNANIIALISTFFITVIPAFLSRTIAGIPEKESVGFFFMFLTFYLFLKAWKSERLITSMIFGFLAGITTGLMGLTWGGVVYIYVTIAIATLVAFLLGKLHKKEIIAYIIWFSISILILQIFTTRFVLKDQLTSLDTGLALVVMIILAVHFAIWNTKISKIRFLQETKLPKNMLSIILSILFIILIVGIALGWGFIIEKINAINQMMFRPITGRWSTTVAENRQPYFTEWASSFGPFIKGIPVLFWLFFIGSIVLFKDMLKDLRKKDAWILTGLYVLFFFGLVFSRYAPHPSVFDGENFISKFIYYGFALLLIGGLVYFYIKYYKEKQEGFDKISFEYLFLLSLFVLCLFTARSAVRLIMVLGPIAPIFVAYLIVKSVESFKKPKDETLKILTAAIMIFILLLSVFVFWNLYKEIKSEAYNMVPSVYNQQWQKAMGWVRDETPETAIFAHWWDYGYWVQSIGKRATVTDGGNAIVYWNYLSGRLVLTGDNQKDALEFLYNHNATHLLIDSSDIGKYGAFSSIGSDKNYDRYSWIGNFLLDETQTQETNNQTLLVYTGGVTLDEDLTINESGKEIFLPGQQAGVGAIIIPIKNNNNTQEFLQPYTIMVYQGKQYKVNLRYLANPDKFVDFGSGIEACAYIFPRLIPQGQGISQNPIGSAMFLSPRLMRSMLTQKYILNDPFKKFPNFKLVHTEQSIIINSLNEQGMKLPDFIYYQGIQGPIKIWEIEYTGDEKIKPEYLDTDASKYIDWLL